MKRGTILPDTLINLILGVVAVSILSFVLFSLLSPSYDAKTETSKGYFDILSHAIEEAKETGMSEVSFFVSPQYKDTFFLVYFGENKLYKDVLYKTQPDSFATHTYTADFFLKKGTSYDACICYRDSEPVEINREIISDPNWNIENDPAYFGGPNSKAQLSFRADVVCSLCYNIGSAVTIESDYDSTTQGTEPNVILLDSLSSVVIKKEGNRYTFDIQKQW